MEITIYKRFIPKKAVSNSEHTFSNNVQNLQSILAYKKYKII